MKEGKTHVLLVEGPHADEERSYKERYERVLERYFTAPACSAGDSFDIIIHAAGLNLDHNLNYDSIQGMLAKLYGVACDACAKNDIDPARSNYIDVRILVLAKWAERSGAGELRPCLLTKNRAERAGPVFTVPMLAKANRPWASVHRDERLTKLLTEGREEGDSATQAKLESMRSDLLYTDAASLDTSSLYNIKDDVRLHKIAIVGGTFDNLHEGHKLLLSATALVLRLNAAAEPTEQRLIVGITGAALLKNKKYAEMLESWETRQRRVFAFLSSVLSLAADDAAVEPECRDDPGPNGRMRIYRLRSGLTVECVEIWDPYGPTITEEAASALVVSAETREGGKAVNDKRAEKGWAPMEVFEVDVLGSEGSSDLKDKISSTEKRRKLYEAQAKADTS